MPGLSRSSAPEVTLAGTSGVLVTFGVGVARFETGVLVSYTRAMRRNWNDGVGPVAVDYPLKLSFGIEQQSFLNSVGNTHGAFVPVVRLSIF